jgi:hypothetical protein
MAAESKESVWGRVAAEVAQQFGLLTGRSPTLTATINQGARYVKPEGDELVFDSRALTLGLLAAGAPDPSVVRYGNAASWFREWLEARIGASTLDEVLESNLTATRAVEDAFNRKVRIALSVSVRDLVTRSAAISDMTVRHTAFEGRHLLAAMIVKGTVAEQLRDMFGLTAISEDETAELKNLLIDRIMRTPAPGETREDWRSALELPGPPPGPGGPEVIRFSHDSGRHGRDVLTTGRDVDALANLVCLKKATPLSVAIFGGWGSGKTTFMDALDEKVEAIAGEAAEAIAAGETSPFVSRVVQIKFNAWQFVDANLWASLTAEFFDQLRAGGWRRAGDVRHAGLVEKVNSHVHSLTAEAAAHRAAVVEGNRHVLEAQEARDAAAKAVREARTTAMGQAAMDALGDLYEGQKGNLRALGIAGGEDPSPGVDAVIEAVRSSRSIVKRSWTIVRMAGKYRAAAALAAFLLLAAAGGLWLLRSDSLESLDIAARIGAAVAALGSFAAFWRTVAPAVNFVNSVARRGADLSVAIEAADETAVKELMGKEVALRDATAEAEARVRMAERADRALARYVDPEGPSNPPRLLRYVLEDDPETKAFEKEIGLIGRARRVFQAVNDIIVKGEGDAPQRIVLYIDDLDRCTEEQVYNVLQAIHLLLAFESFAVVVGVDVKWIEGALAAEFAADRLPPLSEIDRRQHAVHYLEKIFQVAFWLDPLSSQGEGGGSFAAFVNALTKPEEPDSSASGTESTDRARESVTDSGGGKAPQAPLDEPPGAAAKPGVRKRLAEIFRRTLPFESGDARLEDQLAAPKEEAPPESSKAADQGPPAAVKGPAREPFRTVELESVETRFLACPEIARLAGCTPRSVKRLVNVYRLVRSRLADGKVVTATASHPPDYPLVALATAIETGQPVEVATAFLKALDMLPEEIEIAAVLPPAGPGGKPGKTILSMAFAQALAHQLKKNGESRVEAEESGEEKSDSTVIAEKFPGLAGAMAEVHRLRGGRVVVKDVLRVARLARRFSFNRYR